MFLRRESNEVEVQNETKIENVVEMQLWLLSVRFIKKKSCCESKQRAI